MELMNIEQLVPSFETCNRLQENGWAKETIYTYGLNTMRAEDPILMVTSKESEMDKFRRESCGFITISAPTAEEILAELPIMSIIESWHKERTLYETLISLKGTSKPSLAEVLAQIRISNKMKKTTPKAKVKDDITSNDDFHCICDCLMLLVGEGIIDEKTYYDISTHGRSFPEFWIKYRSTIDTLKQKRREERRIISCSLLKKEKEKI